MQIAGIIAEYNPFHNGHLYQITETRKKTKCDFLIVIMSGQFSQRGSAAVCDKFTRAKMALLNGADLVLELPVPFATASAEHFAHFAVSSLHQTHLVNTLSFGSEAGSLEVLSHLADILACPPPSLDEMIRQQLKEGLSYPRAREKALLSYVHSDAHHEAYTAALQNPNNILGIEYLKALKKLDSSIVPLTIQRTGTGYHDQTLLADIASATAIRTQLLEGCSEYERCVPENIQPLLKNALPPNMDSLSRFIHFKLIFSQTEDLYALWDVPNPLIHSLVNVCTPSITYQELASKVTSKTYTKATVNRSLLRMLLNIQSASIQSCLSSGRVPYLRVLGCRKTATSLLKALISQSDVPVITNFAKQYQSLNEQCLALINYEIAATKLYHYLCNQPKLMNQDFTQPFLLV